MQNNTGSNNSFGSMGDQSQPMPDLLAIDNLTKLGLSNTEALYVLSEPGPWFEQYNNTREQENAKTPLGSWTEASTRVTN